MASLRPEKAFQNEIIDYLVNHNGFIHRKNKDYNQTLAMDPDLLIQFIKTTQSDAYADLARAVKGDVDLALVNSIRNQITQKGRSLIEVLKKGVIVSNIKFDLLYRRPATSFNKDLNEKYSQNIFSAMDEVTPSPNDKERIDLVLFVNGLAVISAELKYQPQQRLEDAIAQYRSSRDPKCPLFAFKQGCLVNFAMDQREVAMTTKIDGEATYFRPFNKGKGEGVFAGAGNPTNPNGYDVSYMWEDIWTKETLIDLISNFVFIAKKEDKDERTGKVKESETLIFPRYHQLDAIRRILTDVRANGSSQNYLIQHSAGSGKTNTIAWLAHRLSSLHRADDSIIFDTVIVVTDRIVVDRQLQSALRTIEHKSGLIKVMDDRCSSADLAAALNSNTKIIATTIQKFPYILDRVHELRDKTFAVIIDEAHSSTAGADMKALSDALSSGDQTADDEDFDLEDAITAQLKQTGKRPNLSVFAFTATPKPATLDLFGRVNNAGQKEAFHIYSMRQAIEEGYILDVLQNYTEYKVFLNLYKTVADDPEVDPAQIKLQIARFIDLHPTNIAQRIEIIVEHFRTTVMSGLNGQAKAMVITSSREAAVRCYQAFNKYINDKHYDLKAAVAFSGKVLLKDQDADGHEIDDSEQKEFSESGLNGFRGEQLPKMFDSEKYQVLLAANKYQTGFDQPKLCAMYILKKLSGVNAVQTLSRLNRICPPFDKQIFVLDFVNTAEDMKNAFAPYYTTTLLSQSISISQLYDLDAQLDGYQVSDPDTVDEICSLYLESKQTENNGRIIQKLERIINNLVKIIDRAFDKDEKEILSKMISAFIKNYRFFIQVTSFEEHELHKKYIFWDVLHPYLETGHVGQVYSLKNKIKAEKIHQQKIKTTAKPKIISKPIVKLSITESFDLAADKKEKLSQIIEEINARFGLNLDEAVVTKAIFQIKDLLAQQKELQASAASNTVQEFEFSFYSKLDDALVEGFSQNESFYSLLLKNDEVKREVMGLFVPELYKMFKGNSNSSAAAAKIPLNSGESSAVRAETVI